MIETKFKRIIKDNPNLSSLICYVRAIKGMNYSQEVIEKNLKLVNFDDYSGSGRKELLNWLYTV